MDDPLSSPGRLKQAKATTYAGRAKAKRKRDANTASNGDESDESESEYANNQGETGRDKSAMLSRNTTSKRSPNKIEEYLPGPGSPKRARTAMKPPSEETTYNLHRRTGSVNSLRFAPAPDSSPTVQSVKPTSESVPNVLSVKPASSSSAKHGRSQSLKSLGSLGRPMTPDHMDDVSSIAESSPGSAIRRTQAERVQLFKEDPYCGDMEPHRLLCTRCDTWVNTGKQQTYAVKPWEKHRNRCDQLTPKRLKVKPTQSEDDGETSSIADSINGPSEKPVHRTEAERLAFLEADLCAEVIEPDRVLCKTCQKWIKCSNTQKFALTNWRTHQRRCNRAVPSSRVAAAERKLKLVNDAQSNSFTTNSVECVSCGHSITLGSESDYDLTHWNEHKAQCQGPPSNTAVPSPLIPLPSASVASTDTAVASEQTSPKQGVKRTREVDDDEDDERAPTRPRTASYVPVRKEAPGPWGWFLAPIHAFVRGFREGMGSPSKST